MSEKSEENTFVVPFFSFWGRYNIKDFIRFNFISVVKLHARSQDVSTSDKTVMKITTFDGNDDDFKNEGRE